MTDDTRARLIDEYGELQSKTTKLIRFVASEKYEGLSTVDKSDLSDQLYHMEGYLQVLFRRTARHTGE